MVQRIYLCYLIFTGIWLLSPELLSGQDNQYDEQAVYRNWSNILEQTNSDTTDREIPLYNEISENFYDLFRLTGNNNYLHFALYEAGREKREEIISRLSDNEIIDVDGTINILNGNIDSETYSIRPFSPDDLYLFMMRQIPDSLKHDAEDLLNHWDATLNRENFDQSPLRSALIIQALVYGYDDLRDFQKVHQVSTPLISSNPLPNSTFTFYLYNRIAFAASVSGYYSDALTIYEKVLLPLAYTLGSHDRLLTVKLNYALTLFRIGNVRQALNEFENIYEQDVENLTPRSRSVLFNNLAISYLNSGQFDQYVQFQLEAFQISEKEDNYDQQLNILRNLSLFYWKRSETGMALNYLNQALEISKRHNLPGERAAVLLSLGVYKRETENLSTEALEHFYDALDLSIQTENYQRHYNSYIELGETYHALNQSSEAENYFKLAIDLSSSREDPINRTKGLVRFSNMLIDNNRFSEADSLIHLISNNELEQIPFNLEVLGKNVKIKLLENRGSVNDALAISSTAVDEIFSWLQDSADMQTGHMRMDKEFSEAFQLHTELLRKAGNYEEAIAINGRLRNLSRTGFYNNPLLKSQILSEEELIRDHNLSNKIEDLRGRYSNATEEQKIYLGNQLANANAERNNLLNQAFPNYSTSEYEELLPQAMDALSSDQMIIYFSTFEDQIFQYFITHDGIDMKSYSGNDEQMELLENTVQSFGHASTDLNLLHDVYRTYFAENIPSGIEHIYMIPDGIFYRIPIEILPVSPVNAKNSYGSSKYLIENYSVSYLNTLTDLSNRSSRSNFSYDLAGFGVSNFTEAGHPNLPDLPFSPQEVTNSAEKLSKFRNNRFFINDNSTESNFRSVAGKAKIIHLATHSKVDDENPLFSSLYMFSNNSSIEEDSTDNENDGIVHAYELFDLNLNADLIFLSSCESGSGGYLKGSGILGFSRAFAYAGAQSLSINLWPIRDQTASEISTEFYAALNQGKNKADALREARLHYLNNSNSDPYLWGAFIMYGNIDPPVNNYQFLIQLLLSGLLITGLSFVSLFAYQRKTLIRSWTF